MKKIQLNIDGMHCSSCAMNIDFDLEDVEGVDSSKTSYAKSKCVIEFDDEKVSIEKLIQTIKETGYIAKLDGKGGGL